MKTAVLPPAILPADVAIIVPAYKSRDILATQLPILITWIKSWQVNVEIIVVIDGDDVSAYQQVLDHLPVQLVGYATNKGKGFAIKHGFGFTTAPLIMFTDADIPFTELSMLQMLHSLQQQQSSNIWVIGDRTLPSSAYFDHIPFIRKLGSDFFLLIIKYTLGPSFSDTQCGLKGFTRSAGQLVLERSKINRFAFDFECLYIARHHQLPVIKIPVSLRNQSKSTVRIVRDGLKLLKDAARVIIFNKYD